MEKQMELYLHIPFCAKKCAYCDFLSFPSGQETQRRYVKKLMEEIEAAGRRWGRGTVCGGTVSGGPACSGAPVSTVFIGGGTPSLLDSRWIAELLERLRDSFSIEENAEISMEANPGTVTREKLMDYKRAGINRLSFGLQSADNSELRVLGRIHTWEQFLESFALARECGFDNLNVDLMSALPGQTVESWLRTLEKVTDLDPEHISAYSLMIEEGTPFFDAYGEGRGAGLLPDEDEEREMYHETRSFLRSRGYERYEISNYAKPGRECRHNIGYWTGVPYLGLGLGASSYADGRRFRNEASLAAYLAGTPGRRFEEEILTEKDMQEEFFYVGLRMVQGVSLKEFEERFHVSARDVYPGLIERLVQEGVAVVEGGRLMLTDYGMDVSNLVMAEFLQKT